MSEGGVRAMRDWCVCVTGDDTEGWSEILDRLTPTNRCKSGGGAGVGGSACGVVEGGGVFWRWQDGEAHKDGFL